MDVEKLSNFGINADLWRTPIEEPENTIPQTSPPPPENVPKLEVTKVKVTGINTDLWLTPIEEPILQTLPPPPENIPKLEVTRFKVPRSSRIQRKRIKSSHWISKSSDIPFHDPILSKVDVNFYHSSIDCKFREDIIKLANISLPSQIERFEYESKSFIVVTWLTTARIYEYCSNGKYVEVKRIPDRSIKLSPKLVTSLHYNDSKLYLAYLISCEKDEKESKKPSLEIRDLKGKLLNRPHFYEEPIKMISSNHEFIYLITSSGNAYIHQKDFFSPVCYKVVMRPFISSPLIGFRIDSRYTNNCTKLRLLYTTRDELAVSEYDNYNHRVTHWFRFGTPHEIISIDKVDHLYIIHRNIPLGHSTIIPQTKIEFGFTGLTSRTSCFIHELTYSFKNRIIQVQALKENLYLFGYAKWGESKKYQLGCIYMPNSKPAWVKYLKGVDDDCRILAHDTNIVIIKTCQEISCYEVDTNELYQCEKCKLKLTTKGDLECHIKNDHESIFSDFSPFKNKCLQDLGASVFKKMETNDMSDEE